MRVTHMGTRRCAGPLNNMMKLLLLVVILGFVTADPDLAYERSWQRLQKSMLTNPLLQDAFDKASEQQKHTKDLDISFDCTIEASPVPPQTVHELRPGDIGVVAAVGDSITAGNGIGSEVFLERRGEVWSIGGDDSLDDHVYTLTNVLRKWNPDVQGFSYGITTGAGNANARFNQAVGGARARNMPSQTDTVIELMKSDELIDYENDWKIFTLFIGGNDLCAYCRNRPELSPESHREYLRESLDKLHAQVPRMLVNVVSMFDVTPLTDMSTGPACDLLHEQFCSCAVDEETRPELRAVQVGYYEEMRDLINSGQYDTRDDFTVVLQPSMVDLEPPLDPDTGEPDTSYLSTDCFHPSRKGHHGLALILWNTMLIPVGQKPLEPPVDEDHPEFSCPTSENPYIFTNLNSGLKKKQPHTHNKPLPEVFAVAGDNTAQDVDEDNTADNANDVVGVFGIIVAACVGMVLIGTLTLGVILPILNKDRQKKKEETELKTLEVHDLASVSSTSG